MVATVSQHGASVSGGPDPRGQPKEIRRKAGQKERTVREDHAGWASPVKIFQNAGDVKNSTAGL
jgi:hypothetical protein